MNGKEDSSALEILGSLIEDSPEAARAGRRERLRLELARYMKKARDEVGMTQQEVAQSLGVTQAWVSKLESPNYDHKLESVLTYFDALGAQMNLSVDIKATTFQIWGTSPASVWEGEFTLADLELYCSPLLSDEQVADGVYWSWNLPGQQGEHTLSGRVVDIEQYRKAATTKPDVGEVPRKASAT